MLAVPVKDVLAHCEIPCGIYDDQTRVQLIHEHIGTIEKAMTKQPLATKDDIKRIEAKLDQLLAK